MAKQQTNKQTNTDFQVIMRTMLQMGNGRGREATYASNK